MQILRVPSLLPAVALVALLGGCTQKRASSKTTTATRPAPVSTLPPVAGESNKNDGESTEKRPRFGEAAVYVDGRSLGVVRVSELPSALKPHMVDVGGGYTSIQYGVLEYARALGVDTKRLKAMHLYGGSRVAIVDHAELARIGEGVTFSFVQGDRGKPRINWPAMKLHTNTTIDMLSNITLYVDKEPPTLKDGELVMPNGTPVEGKVPYAPEEQGNGTRVYVDGSLVGVVKRKRLTNEMLVAKAGAETSKAKTDKADSTDDRYSVVAYASMLRGAASQAKTIELIAGDDVVGRFDAKTALGFNVPPRNRGQAVVDVPVAGTIKRARVSAIQIFVNSQPTKRPIVEIDEAANSASGQGQGGSRSDDEL